MATMEYVISGHSNNVGDEYFTVPPNVTLVFMAKENEMCAIMRNARDYKIAIELMKEYPDKYDTYSSGAWVKNYHISYDMDLHNNYLPFNGISFIDSDNNVTHFEAAPNNLQDIIKRIQTHPRKRYIIYCIICRGDEEVDFEHISEQEFRSLEGEFNPYDDNITLDDMEGMDFNMGFDMDIDNFKLSGGKKRKNTNKKRNKKRKTHCKPNCKTHCKTNKKRIKKRKPKCKI